MTDERLRRLERAWRASGTAEDEAAWLSARERAGELTRDQLERAASMNHAAARLALHLSLRPRLLPLSGLPGDVLDPIPGDPCVRCWGGVLVDPSPDGGPTDDFEDYTLRCATCGAEQPAIGIRRARDPDHERASEPRERYYQRVLPSIEQIAQDRVDEELRRESREEDEVTRRGHDRPALRPEPTLWQRVLTFLGGPDPMD